MANAITNRNQKVGMATYLSSDAVRKNISSVIGEKNTTKFVSSVVSAVQTNPLLAECSNGSILSAALLGESLQLTPSPQLGMFYMVPYSVKGKGKEAQFQLGYKGYIQLAIRSGQYRKIVATEVKEGEIKDYNPITEDFTLTPILDMAKRANLPTVGYYGMFELNNGFRKEIYWSKEQIHEHAVRYSRGYAKDLREKTAYTFWAKDFDNMAKKTILRQLISKWGIMSIEMQKAYEGDMGVIQEDGTVRYVDNEADVVEDAQVEIAENANKEFLEVEDADFVDSTKFE